MKNQLKPIKNSKSKSKNHEFNSNKTNNNNSINDHISKSLNSSPSSSPEPNTNSEPTQQHKLTSSPLRNQDTIQFSKNDSSSNYSPLHASYVLLAEFDIDSGSGLKHQFPSPTGTAEHVLADLMLPDGAHDRNEDWTVFFLNQTPRLSVSYEPNSIHQSTSTTPTPQPRRLNSESKLNKPPQKSNRPLLYVISLVRTKKDNSVRRGAICKAMAVCSHHPYIQIFKPILLLALEDYFVNPSVDCLARLFHAINMMDTSGLPHLSYHEKLILRCSERQDMFEEKFLSPPPSSSSENRELIEGSNSTLASSNHQILTGSNIPQFNNSSSNNAKVLTTETTPETPILASSSSFISFDNSLIYSNHPHQRTSSGSLSNCSSNESPIQHGHPQIIKPSHSRTASNLGANLNSKSSNPNLSTPSVFSFDLKNSHSFPNLSSHKRPRDTHFFDTKIDYAGKAIPVRIPLQTFAEEVGDYSLIKLVQTFSSPNALNLSGPLHPHLHSSGIFTHPIILLFNALVTQKRIVFLGHGLPARHVSEMVLAACALGSGCGGVLEGFISRAFPYCNLTIYEDFKAIPGYIAGVTNPIFELHTDAWDVFCNIETGKITVSKDISMPVQLLRPFSPVPPERSATESTTTSGIALSGATSNKDDNIKSINSLGATHLKLETAKDSADNILMEEIIQAIHAHFGEPIIRARFMDYIRRFIKISSRWEEDQYGTSAIGIKSSTFKLLSTIKSRSHHISQNKKQDQNDGVESLISNEKINFLGSGAVFADEESATKKEIALNSSRIEGFRDSLSYQNLKKQFQMGGETHFDYDIGHQISRLRLSRKMSEIEVETIYEVLVNTIKTDEQIIEVLSGLPSYLGGLLPLSFGLFHTSKKVRSLSVELIRKFEAHPIGQKFFQSLNRFNQLSYQRLAHYQLVQPSPDLSSSNNDNNDNKNIHNPVEQNKLVNSFQQFSFYSSPSSNSIGLNFNSLHDRHSSIISEHDSFLEF